MAPGDTAAQTVKQHKPRTMCASRTAEAECAADGSFVFEAQEAWKDFHNSLRQFYENGELCDVTLKVRPASRDLSTDHGPVTAPCIERFVSCMKEAHL